MINTLKINDSIYINFEEKEMLEDGYIKWNIPTNLDEFKKIAIDTINWKVGDSIKKALGNTNVNLSASNSKGIALLSKVINAQNPDTSSLTDLELDSYNKMVSLADGGYSDSELLNILLTNVSEFIASASDKVARVTEADSIDNIIIILNDF